MKNYEEKLKKKVKKKTKELDELEDREGELTDDVTDLYPYETLANAKGQVEGFQKAKKLFKKEIEGIDKYEDSLKKIQRIHSKINWEKIFLHRLKKEILKELEEEK